MKQPTEREGHERNGARGPLPATTVETEHAQARSVDGASLRIDARDELDEHIRRIEQNQHVARYSVGMGTANQLTIA
jgi:hypothetical protein